MTSHLTAAICMHFTKKRFVMSAVIIYIYKLSD